MLARVFSQRSTRREEAHTILRYGGIGDHREKKAARILSSVVEMFGGCAGVVCSHSVNIVRVYTGTPSQLGCGTLDVQLSSTPECSVSMDFSEWRVFACASIGCCKVTTTIKTNTA
jgi:hypothetical protein